MIPDKNARGLTNRFLLTSYYIFLIFKVDRLAAEAADR